MDIQLSILQFFQSLRSGILDTLFLILTISTEIPVIVLLTTIMYWCINKKYGQKILFSLVGNVAINSGIKDVIKAKRPIGIEGIISQRVSTATGYSFPSGHTQTATSFWTSIIIIFKNTWISIIGAIIILGVGISRLYLGVHWPIDVIFGWGFGIIFTVIFSKFFDYVDNEKKYLSLVLMLIPFALVAFLVNSSSYIKSFGLLTGFVLGYIVEDRYIQFETVSKNKNRINFSNKKDNKIAKNICRFLLGIITLA